MDTSVLANNAFYRQHCQLLCQSYQEITGRQLVAPNNPLPLTSLLFNAPFALVSHGTEADPVFNFGNRTALSLFEFSWEDFICLPSRCSAEPVHREERGACWRR